MVNSFARFERSVEIVFDVFGRPVDGRNVVAVLETARENAQQDADVECSLIKRLVKIVIDCERPLFNSFSFFGVYYMGILFFWGGGL